MTSIHTLHEKLHFEWKKEKKDYKILETILQKIGVCFCFVFVLF